MPGTSREAQAEDTHMSPGQRPDNTNTHCVIHILGLGQHSSDTKAMLTSYLEEK